MCCPLCRQCQNMSIPIFKNPQHTHLHLKLSSSIILFCARRWRLATQMEAVPEVPSGTTSSHVCSLDSAKATGTNHTPMEQEKKKHFWCHPITTQPAADSTHASVSKSLPLSTEQRGEQSHVLATQKKKKKTASKRVNRRKGKTDELSLRSKHFSIPTNWETWNNEGNVCQKKRICGKSILFIFFTKPTTVGLENWAPMSRRLHSFYWFPGFPFFPCLPLPFSLVENMEGSLSCDKAVASEMGREIHHTEALVHPANPHHWGL